MKIRSKVMNYQRVYGHVIPNDWVEVDLKKLFDKHEQRKESELLEELRKDINLEFESNSIPESNRNQTESQTDVTSFEDMTVKELIEVMRVKGISQTRGESKDEMIAKIKGE